MSGAVVVTGLFISVTIGLFSQDSRDNSTSLQSTVVTRRDSAMEC